MACGMRTRGVAAASDLSRPGTCVPCRWGCCPGLTENHLDITLTAACSFDLYVSWEGKARPEPKIGIVGGAFQETISLELYSTYLISPCYFRILVFIRRCSCRYDLAIAALPIIILVSPIEDCISE